MTPEQLRQRRRERKIIRPSSDMFNYEGYDIVVGDCTINFIPKSPGRIIPLPFPFGRQETIWQRIKRFFTRG